VAADETLRTHTPPAPHGRVAEHISDAVNSATTHPVAATHPPTISDALDHLWPGPDEVRHGLAGQIAAAAVGLVQVAGLAICWQTAHVCFATKTRTAISLLTFAVTLLVWAVAAHA
jgi:hypothetical protein